MYSRLKLLIDHQEIDKGYQKSRKWRIVITVEKGGEVTEKTLERDIVTFLNHAKKKDKIVKMLINKKYIPITLNTRIENA